MTVSTTREFLNTVITPAEAGGYLLLAIGGNGHGWNEQFFEWPNQLDDALGAAAEYAAQTNVYFSSYLFSDKRSLKDNVLPSRTIQADLDEADPLTLPLQPTILVQTSQGRYQGYWVLNDYANSTEAHEILSRKLTYSIPLCDHSGWPLGRKVRLPNTLNHKYLEGPQGIKVTQSSLRLYKESDLELLPDISIVELQQYSEEFLDNPPKELDIGAYELLNQIKSKIPESVHQYMSQEQKDRSAALWHLLCALFRAGLSREQVFFLARKSVNNKFADLRFNADRELAKDVLRAQQAVTAGVVDTKGQILQIRNTRGHTAEKRQFIFGLVRDRMREEGEFLRAYDEAYFVRRDLGKPIPLSVRAQDLHHLLDIEFGLNHTEIEHDYVLNSLCAFGSTLPNNAITGSLSHYMPEQHAMLLHTGRKDVLKITPQAVERTIDGSYGIIFVWSHSGEPFNPTLTTTQKWDDILFSGCFDNVVGITKEEALAILKTWFLFFLFKSNAVSRPILSFFGQPGSGKSTLFRRLYTLVYGSQRALDSITTPDNFDQAVSEDPLVVLDNVDTWQPWLPDRLAQAASTSDILKRKLYFDKDTVVVKRQAMVGITAHNPRFGREDIADRLLIINFERLTHFESEGEIIDRILNERNAMWGSIVQDIQKILATPMPPYSAVPQFRIEDYARIGLWIATALGFADTFVRAIDVLKSTAVSFLMEEDSILIDALQRFVNKSKQAGEWVSVAALWNELQTYAVEADRSAFDRNYKNAVFLGKKLWAMQTVLKEAFSVEWRFNTSSGARQWKIAKKLD